MGTPNGDPARPCQTSSSKGACIKVGGDAGRRADIRMLLLLLCFLCMKPRGRRRRTKICYKLVGEFLSILFIKNSYHLPATKARWVVYKQLMYPHGNDRLGEINKLSFGL